MNQVFSMSALIKVQDIKVTTKAGRVFTVDLIENASPNKYTSELLIDDKHSVPQALFRFYVKPEKVSKEDAYEAALNSVLAYLNENDSNDEIEEINNVCNCEFIDASTQQSIVKKLGISVSVEVNKC